MGREYERRESKKLRDAAAWFVCGDQAERERQEAARDEAIYRADCARYGLLYEPPLPVLEPQDFELWEENVPAFELFNLCQTQWRVAGGCFVGLDYAAVFEVGKMFSCEDPLDRFMGLRVIESEALRLLREPHK